MMKNVTPCAGSAHQEITDEVETLGFASSTLGFNTVKPKVISEPDETCLPGASWVMLIGFRMGRTTIQEMLKEFNMNQSLIYRLSLGLTVVLALAAFIAVLGWFGTLARGAGHLPILALLPWAPLGLMALAAINCTLRARLLVRRGEEG